MVGFTTTIPLVVLVAAGRRPVDLNNIFITAPDPQALIEDAEIDGFPRNICAWIKGLYGAVVRHGIDEVIAVTEGDCSNTRALMEVLSLRGTTTIPFSYPHDRSRQSPAPKSKRPAKNLTGSAPRSTKSIGSAGRKIASAARRITSTSCAPRT